MAKPSTRALLNSILSDDLEQVYISITNRAMEWAVAGFLKEANYLLSELWKYSIPHSGHLWLPDEGLQIMWEVAGQQPLSIPFSFKDIGQIEDENWSRAFYPCGDEDFRERILPKTFDELNDNEVFFKAINAGYDYSEKPATIIKALQRAVKGTSVIGHSYFHATTCGALLSARNDFAIEATYFIKKWGEGYSKYWVNYSLAYLMRDRTTAAFLLQGLLAPLFRLTPAVCQKEITDILDVLAKRMLGGRTLVYGKFSWRELLGKISQLAIEQKTMAFSEETLLRKSLCKPSASTGEIKGVEQRLNIILSDDYKEFLLTSNGFECFSSTGIALAPAEKVDFLKNVDEQLIDIWGDSMEEFDPSFGSKLKSSIIVGGHAEEQQLLLVPLQDNNWECWHFSSWRPGEVVYESFRFYMEDELQRLEDDFFTD